MNYQERRYQPCFTPDRFWQIMELFRGWKQDGFTDAQVSLKIRKCLELRRWQR